jgi:tetratricopeptide (TPR) repeat protein
MNRPNFQTELNRLLEMQARTHQGGKHDAYGRYMVTLNHMWNAGYHQAIDTATSALAEYPEHEQNALFYRAWIESLSALEDWTSLRTVYDHLFDLSHEDTEYAVFMRPHFLGLRGLIHLELDQAPAWRLHARALAGRTDSPYILEFLERCARRSHTDHAKDSLCILQCQTDIQDFFVWQTLLTDLNVAADVSSTRDVLKFFDARFLGHPVRRLYDMHMGAEHHQWQVAYDAAKSLMNDFTGHVDYRFFAAKAAFHAGHLHEALSLCEQVSPQRLAYDVDFNMLMGQILAMKALKDDDEDAAHRAIDVLNLAARMQRRVGLGIEYTLDLIRQMEELVGGHSVPVDAANHFRELKSWLVMLSPKQAFELVGSRDHDIEKLCRPMGCEPQPGDVVLFVSRSAHVSKKIANHRSEWRLLAIYRVASRPVWNPTNRWQSTLELIDRPEHPVPVDAQEINSDINMRGKKSGLARGHHARFGVYALDESAMDIMIAAVKRRTEGVDHGALRRQVDQQVKKPGG